MNKNFNIKGSLTTTGDVNVQGSLNVKGSVTTIKQETLTIKDNFIGVNGNGTTLDTTGMAGIIAITGEENCVLKTGWYKIDAEKLVEALDIHTEDYTGDGYWVDIDEYGPYKLAWNENAYYNFNQLRLTFSGCKVKDKTAAIDYSSHIEVGFEDPGPTGWVWAPYGENLDFNIINPSIISFEVSKNPSTPVEIYISEDDKYISSFYFENQIIPENDIDFVCSFLVHEDGNSVTGEDFAVGAQAYAAPIYDKNQDSLRIGLGSYERDENGNVKSFIFGAGQSQSIATRNDTIEHDHIIKWDGISHQLVDTGTSIDDYLFKNENAPWGTILFANGRDTAQVSVSGTHTDGVLGDSTTQGKMPKYVHKDYDLGLSVDSDWCLGTGTPKSPYAAANKKYVDDSIAAALDSGSANDVTKEYVDESIATAIEEAITSVLGGAY